jgi:putative protein-disulfide isomerase
MIKKLLFCLSICIAGIAQAQNVKPKLIYIADPLCSWCYGFQSELDKVLHQYADSLQIELVVGGMGIGNKKILDQEFKESLNDHWTQVHKHTGQVFDHKMINTKGLIYNSEPICQAIVAAKTLDSSKALTMHKKLQTAFYAQNKNVTKFPAILEVAVEVGLDTAAFREIYFSEANKKKTIAEFKRVEKNGVDTFPVLILVSKKETILINEGYNSHKDVIKKLKKTLKY